MVLVASITALERRGIPVEPVGEVPVCATALAAVVARQASMLAVPRAVPRLPPTARPALASMAVAVAAETTGVPLVLLPPLRTLVARAVTILVAPGAALPSRLPRLGTTARAAVAGRAAAEEQRRSLQTPRRAATVARELSMGSEARVVAAAEAAGRAQVPPLATVVAALYTAVVAVAAVSPGLPGPRLVAAAAGASSSLRTCRKQRRTLAAYVVLVAGTYTLPGPRLYDRSPSQALTTIAARARASSRVLEPDFIRVVDGCSRKARWHFLASMLRRPNFRALFGDEGDQPRGVTCSSTSAG